MAGLSKNTLTNPAYGVVPTCLRGPSGKQPCETRASHKACEEHQNEEPYDLHDTPSFPNCLICAR